MGRPVELPDFELNRRPKQLQLSSAIMMEFSAATLRAKSEALNDIFDRSDRRGRKDDAFGFTIGSGKGMWSKKADDGSPGARKTDSRK
jgi:hypothetical protein